MVLVSEGKLKAMMRGEAHDTALQYFQLADQLTAASDAANAIKDAQDKVDAAMKDVAAANAQKVQALEAAQIAETKYAQAFTTASRTGPGSRPAARGTNTPGKGKVLASGAASRVSGKDTRMPMTAVATSSSIRL